MNKVRTANPSDQFFIIEAQLKMALETEDQTLNKSTVEKGVQAVFDEPKKGRYFVVEVDGEIAGCLLTLREWSDWRNKDVLWIHSVYIAEKFRKQGLYREMYAHLVDLVKRSPDLCGLRLYVDKRNTTASQVYEKLGMDGSHYNLFEWMNE